ncbi:hypothetical protein B0T13DRAFT_91083 [Neurospora crassa]|nr:hypothetical protein B0T13DRAFT_91083 [Neurospora crassa]
MMGGRHYSILVFLFSFVLGWIGKKTWVAGKNCFSLHLDFLYFLVFSHLVMGCTTTSGWISSRRQPSSPAQRIMAPISFSCHITPSSPSHHHCTPSGINLEDIHFGATVSLGISSHEKGSQCSLGWIQVIQDTPSRLLFS